MRLAYPLILVLLLAAPAAAYSSRATGSDWAADYYGHPDHLAWVDEHTGDHLAQTGSWLDTCLDHNHDG